MKIKEIEQRTHLSSKAIRFYEEKGLIHVKRDESDYREYDESDMNELLKIKLLRKCGLSIQDLINLKNEHMQLDDILYQHIGILDKQDLNIQDQKELCLDVIKAKGDYHSLFEKVHILESDDYHDLVEDTIETRKVSLSQQIFTTLIALGPILSCFLFLDMKQYDRLWMGFSLSIVATIFLTWSWTSFIKRYKFQKESLKSSLLHFGLMFGLVLVLILVVIGTYIAFNSLQQFVFMKESIYIMNTTRGWSWFFLIVGLEIALIIIGLLALHMKHKDLHDYYFLMQWAKKYKWLILSLNVIVICIAFFQVTTVSQSEIVSYSPLHPFGVTYTYEDVETVECGFYENGFWIFHEKGEFYYQLTMKDGKVLTFEDTHTTPEFEKDTYTELVQLDHLVMKYQPQKISSSKYSQYAILDQKYIDRFLSIVNHK